MWYNVSEIFLNLICKLFVKCAERLKMRHKRVTLTEIDGFVRDEIFGSEKKDDSQLRSLVIRRIMFDSTTDKQRLYLLMYYRDGLTMDEIADRCGVVKSTVSRTVARGRSRILKGLEDKELRRILKRSDGKE